MAKEHEKVMTKKEGALHGVKIIDLSDERAIYGVKLLADLGADVVRPEPIEGDPLRARGPLRDGEQSADSSLWHAFSHRTDVSLPLSWSSQKAARNWTD